MILKKRLFTLIFLLTISHLDSTNLPPNTNVPKSTSLGNQPPQPSQPSNTDYTKPFKSKKENPQTIDQTPAKQEIGSLTALTAIARNIGVSLLGPVLETALSIGAYGIKSAYNTLAGDENKERRENLYTGLAAGGISWTLYRLYHHQPIIPSWNAFTGWFDTQKKYFVAKTQNFTSTKNKKDKKDKKDKKNRNDNITIDISEK